MSLISGFGIGLENGIMKVPLHNFINFFFFLGKNEVLFIKRIAPFFFFVTLKSSRNIKGLKTFAASVFLLVIHFIFYSLNTFNLNT